MAGQVKRRVVDDSGREAWIEGDVARLRIAAGGKVLVDRMLNRSDPANWAYEGCWVEYLEWWGDRVVVISSEEKSTVLSSISTSGHTEARQIARPWIVHGDLVVWESEDEPGLLAATGLPLLLPRTPLPMRDVSRYLELAGEDGRVVVSRRSSASVERLALPSPAQRSFPGAADDFFGLVERRLVPAGAATPSLRMLVEATTISFCRDPTASPSCSPVWLPVYWHRYLAAAGRRAEAEEHLSLLDAVAASLPEDEPERGWDATWDFLDGAVTLATRHVRRQARVQAAVCRTGELPQSWWCLLFEPAPRSSIPGSRVDASSLPPTLRRTFEILAPTGPPPITHRY